MTILMWKRKGITFLGNEGKRRFSTLYENLLIEEKIYTVVWRRGKTHFISIPTSAVLEWTDLYTTFGLWVHVTTWNQVKDKVSCFALAHSDAATETASSGFAFWLMFGYCWILFGYCLDIVGYCLDIVCVLFGYRLDIVG